MFPRNLPGCAHHVTPGEATDSFVKFFTLMCFAYTKAELVVGHYQRLVDDSKPWSQRLRRGPGVSRAESHSTEDCMRGPRGL